MAKTNEQPVSIVQTGMVEVATDEVSKTENITGAVSEAGIIKEDGTKNEITEIRISSGIEINWELNKEVQEKIKKWSVYNEKTGELLFVYDSDNFDKDIQTFDKNSDWLYENHIQLYSKQKKFNKALSLQFINDIKNWNLQDAEKLLENNDLHVVLGKEFDWTMISPFYPTCCSFKSYIAAKQYKNGLLWMFISWNGSWGYSFFYITALKSSLVEFSFISNFSEETSENPGELSLFYQGKKILWPTKIQNEYSTYMKDLFTEKKINPDFTKEIEKVKQAIDALYK